MKTFITIIVIILIIGAFWFFSHGKYGSNNQPAATTSTITTNSVTISNFAFSPSSISASANTPITFTNNDSVTHTVTADNGKFDQQISSGQTITITIANPGAYTYHCKIHPNMTGTIIVK